MAMKPPPSNGVAGLRDPRSDAEGWPEGRWSAVGYALFAIGVVSRVRPRGYPRIRIRAQGATFAETSLDDRRESALVPTSEGGARRESP